MEEVEIMCAMQTSATSTVILVESVPDMLKRLQTAYSSQSNVFETASSVLSTEKGNVDRLYESVQNEKSTLTLAALKEERTKYQGIFSKFSGVRASADALCREFQGWADMTGKKSEVQTQITKLMATVQAMGPALLEYSQSLKYFCAIVDNEGRPLNLLQRGALYWQDPPSAQAQPAQTAQKEDEVEIPNEPVESKKPVEAPKIKPKKKYKEVLLEGLRQRRDGFAYFSGDKPNKRDPRRMV